MRAGDLRRLGSWMSNPRGSGRSRFLLGLPPGFEVTQIARSGRAMPQAQAAQNDATSGVVAPPIGGDGCHVRRPPGSSIIAALTPGTLRHLPKQTSGWRLHSGSLEDPRVVPRWYLATVRYGERFE
jgi:hypothetical protein